MNELYKENDLQRLRVLSGSTLKLIAIFTMLIDHIGAVIVSSYYSYAYDIYTLDKIYYILRCIGRLAFPLFCYLASEGFKYTKDRKKYILRVFIFALMSELPFDYAFTGGINDFSQQNVMFTIALALLGLYFYDIINRKYKYSAFRIVSVVPLALAAVIASFLHTDYSYAGVLAIIFMYIAESFSNRIIGFFAGACLLSWVFGGTEFFAVFGIIPIILYNGKRGLRLKYFFYLFYPIHLILLRVAWIFIEKSFINVMG